MIGILFVVSSSKGHSLLFSYPFPPDSPKWVFSPGFLASLLSPKPRFCNKPFVLSIDGHTFIGQAAQLDIYSHFINLIQSKTSLVQPVSVLMFNMIIVTRQPCHLYDKLLSQISTVLAHEQMQRNYIKKQVDIIQSVKEACLVENISDPNPKLLQSSSLARSLANVFNHLNESSIPRMNSGQDDLELLNHLHPLSTESQEYPEIRPYQTLLLLYDKDDLLQSLPRGSAPLVTEMIRYANPLKCFEEFEVILNCSLSQIYKIAAHLVYWKKARIIDTVSIRNVYAVSPKADLSRIAILQQELQAGSVNLCHLLSVLSIPKPLSSVLPPNTDKGLYLDMIVLLLKHDFISQFIDLKQAKESHIPAGSATSQSEALLEIINPDVHLIAEPDTLSEEEKASLNRNHSPSIVSLFNRLLPFLNGKVHVDEILSREQISRKELKAVVGHYRDEIIPVLYM